jgi:hypothetical protein
VRGQVVVDLEGNVVSVAPGLRQVNLPGRLAQGAEVRLTRFSD